MLLARSLLLLEVLQEGSNDAKEVKSGKKTVCQIITSPALIWAVQVLVPFLEMEVVP